MWMRSDPFNFGDRMNSIVIVLTAMLATLRIVGNTSPLYQAAAHLFVGALIGAYYVDRRPKVLGLIIGLSVFELVCFLLTKHI